MKVKMMTKDQVTLQGEWFKAAAARAIVLLNPGTATKTSFYRPFVEFLVGQGYHVFLWNYRGFGESKEGSLKDRAYQFSDIGFYDIPAAIDYVKDCYPDLPLYCIGHSAGGQQLGLANNFDKIDGLIVVAASAGYFAYMPFFYRIKANFFFRFFAPISSLIFGYVPASKLNLMEDLTAPLAREWGEWCREKELFFSPRLYGKIVAQGTGKNFKMPIHVFVADDDEICTEKNMKNFWKNISSSEGIFFTKYKARDFPSQKIGHFGYFKKGNQRVWFDLLKVLQGFDQEGSDS